MIYRPETERWIHYFNARLADQFDAIVHIDVSSALEPLDRIAAWDPSEADIPLGRVIPKMPSNVRA